MVLREMHSRTSVSIFVRRYKDQKRGKRINYPVGSLRNQKKDPTEIVMPEGNW